MRLASVEVIPYALPFKEPYATARGVLERREMVLLRLRDENGVEGLGEAVPLSLRGGLGLAEVVRELEKAGELFREGLLGGEAMGDLSAPARCALTTAKMDLLGRRSAPERSAPEGAPGDEGAPIPCNATLVAGPPDAVAAEAERWAEDRFTTFKLKLGAESAKTLVQQGFSRTRGAEQLGGVEGAAVG